ncbi:MAG: hypothetical protein M0Q26_10735 [Chitinophagaceae bacterium]|nr:hypothetical protein [Chitinophagaceae bacterium]MDP1762751.1 hypothetical protein [Sediminibacterium sp.]MDP1810192.1 hypothetical protein [Sediminibacterium sp.]MDP3127898.1 hypothetical protein [Sediminibacterium sp.]MDP3666851.1 hypothetical protein [Sediminibacterium sp.]
MKKILWIVSTILLVVLAIFIYWRFYFVLAEGTQAGTLNIFQKKGIIFKTYEGKIILSGFKANVQSNEFSFSVTKEPVAQELLKVSGREVNIHYKQYFGSLPWRGMQKFIVDSIYEVRGVQGESILKPKES